MLAGLQVAQRVPLARVHLQLVRLVVLDQLVDQLRRVEEVHVLVDQAVDNQQSVVPEMGLDKTNGQLLFINTTKQLDG